MTEKTQKQKIDIMYQAMVGIDDNPKDNGLIGKVDAIEEHLRILNGQVKTNTTFRKLGTWVSSAIFTGIVALLIAIATGSI